MDSIEFEFMFLFGDLLVRRDWCFMVFIFMLLVLVFLFVLFFFGDFFFVMSIFKINLEVFIFLIRFFFLNWFEDFFFLIFLSFMVSFFFVFCFFCNGEFWSSVENINVFRLILVIMRNDFFYLYLLMRYWIRLGNIIFLSFDFVVVIFVVKFLCLL